MRKPTFSRRDVLKGSTAFAASSVFASVASAAPPASTVTPATDRGGEERRQGRLLHLDRPAGRGAHRQGVRGEISGIAVRVERTGAERVFQRIGQEYASRIHAVDVVNSSDASHFIVWKREGILEPYVPEDVAKYYPAEHKDPGRHVRELPRLALRHRLQHQHGEGRGGAQELCRSARSEMDGQDRQGASGLQRHHHDRDLSDGARSRLGVFREARQAEGACRCSPRPTRPRSSRSASAR